ncbi:MAG TPA: hypothetical protein D7I13_00530 [Candidatus Poseidoniales archaeon]|nr:MAG TPA: hypothetical protein D7I13_00530 [Candidatus Poseidoniales archaeon]
MSWFSAAFAPRRDHKGMSTPSYAARWWLPICTLSSAVWSWQATDGFLVMAAALTVMIATPLLSIGWYVIGIVSARVAPRYIIPQAEGAHKARLERKARQARNKAA